jgi:Dyp-type peroxidase family
MTLNLDQTLAWTKSLAAHTPDAAAELAMLNDLQGNILKGHGRGHTINFFLAFDKAQHPAARRFISELGADVTTALDQLTGAQVFKATGKSASPFMTLLLTADGYRALGIEDVMPPGQAFADGMQNRQLNDPPQAQWDPGLSGDIHALLIIGASSAQDQSALQAEFTQRFAASDGAVRLLTVELGKSICNRDKNGIEHFGYVDGRSQPLALQEDVDLEARDGGIDQWDPAIPLSQLLVKCPGGQLDVSCGSYFVFRKLEQNVQGFKRREIELAEILPGAGERAGASVVGRFENGTPVSASATEIPVAKPGPAGVPNNFNFSDDAAGLKCPFAGHIRKTNPRTDTGDSKDHLMARRGIPYGDRTDDPNDGILANKPTGGLGLLFMAYQRDLENQFEFTQRFWVDNKDFRNPGTGIDPILGQPPGAGPQRYPKVYGVSLSEPFDFSGFVTMRGGAYFFAPSVSFFKRLGAR